MYTIFKAMKKGCRDFSLLECAHFTIRNRCLSRIPHKNTFSTLCHAWYFPYLNCISLSECGKEDDEDI